MSKEREPEKLPKGGPISRRNFLRLSGLLVGGLGAGVVSGLFSPFPRLAEACVPEDAVNPSCGPGSRRPPERIPSPTPTPTPQEKVSKEPKPLIEIAKENSYSAEVSGVRVRFTLAIHPSLYNTDKTNRMVDIYPNTGIFPDAVAWAAEYTLRYFHLAWIQDNPGERENISFEQYLELVKQGKGSFWVMGSEDDPSKYPTIRERAKIRPIEIDPLTDEIVHVYSNRANLPVQFTSKAGLWILKNKNRVYIERTFPEAPQKEDLNFFSFRASREFINRLRCLIINDGLLSGKAGQIGAKTEIDPRVQQLQDDFLKPQREKRTGIFWAVQG